MRLQSRHYVFIAVIAAVFVYNLVHRRHATPAATPAPVHVVSGPRPETPAWTAFDHAAALRDAPDTAFQPELDALHRQIEGDPAATGIQGCLTWLDFYRHGVNHPSRDTAWQDRSRHHLDGCTTYHLDTSL